MSVKTLEELIKKYDYHPDFIGMELGDPNLKGAVDDALIHIISRRGEVEEIALLLDNKVGINVKGDMGYTPLHYAAMNNRERIVAYLLLRGADPSVRNEDGQTALDLAIKLGNAEAASVLRKHGRQ